MAGPISPLREPSPLSTYSFFSMFIVLKSQTSAIKFDFSFINNQSNSEVRNLTSKSDVVYNALLVFLSLISL